MKNAETVVDELIVFHKEKLIRCMIGVAESVGLDHMYYEFTNVRSSECDILKRFLEDNGCDISRIEEGIIAFDNECLVKLKETYFDELSVTRRATKKVVDILEHRLINLIHGDAPNPFHIEVPWAKDSDVQAAVDEFNAHGYDIKHLKLADGIHTFNIGIFGKNTQIGKLLYV